MFRVQYLILFLALVACATPVGAQSGNPDLDLSTASREYSGPEWLSVMIVPDGSGDSLEQAMLPDGSRTSGVVTVRLVDWFGNPVVNYDYQNITLNGTKYRYVYGATISGPTWKRYMDRVLSGLPKLTFPSSPPPELGTFQIVMPDVQGMTIDDARNAINDALNAHTAPLLCNMRVIFR